MSEKLREMLRAHEGVRLKPYKCTAGKTTIGIGRNLDDCGITKSEAEYLFDNDVTRAVKQANTLHWFSSLDEVRQDCVVMLLFSMGLARFLDFRRMIRALERRQYAEAGAELLDSKWREQVGDRAMVLATMISTGAYPE